MQIFMFSSFFFSGVDFIKCVSYGLFIIKFNDNHILTIWTAFLKYHIAIVTLKFLMINFFVKLWADTLLINNNQILFFIVIRVS